MAQPSHFAGTGTSRWANPEYIPRFAASKNVSDDVSDVQSKFFENFKRSSEHENVRNSGKQLEAQPATRRVALDETTAVARAFLQLQGDGNFIERSLNSNSSPLATHCVSKQSDLALDTELQSASGLLAERTTPQTNTFVNKAAEMVDTGSKNGYKGVEDSVEKLTEILSVLMHAIVKHRDNVIKANDEIKKALSTITKSQQQLVHVTEFAKAFLQMVKTNEDTLKNCREGLEEFVNVKGQDDYLTTQDNTLAAIRELLQSLLIKKDLMSNKGDANGRKAPAVEHPFKTRNGVEGDIPGSNDNGTASALKPQDLSFGPVKRVDHDVAQESIQINDLITKASKRPSPTAPRVQDVNKKTSPIEIESSGLSTKVLLENLPQTATTELVTRIIWGGRILRIQYKAGESTCLVQFLESASCYKYVADTATHGIAWPGDLSRRIRVSRINTRNEVDIHRQEHIGSNMSRVVRVFRTSDRVTKTGIMNFAIKDNREVERVREAKDKLGRPAFEIRFLNLIHALAFVKDAEADFEMDELEAEVIFAKDPCDVATGIQS
jgi:hypothetical protein